MSNRYLTAEHLEHLREQFVYYTMVWEYNRLNHIVPNTDIRETLRRIRDEISALEHFLHE